MNEVIPFGKDKIHCRCCPVDGYSVPQSSVENNPDTECPRSEKTGCGLKFSDFKPHGNVGEYPLTPEQQQVIDDRYDADQERV